MNANKEKSCNNLPVTTMADIHLINRKLKADEHPVIVPTAMES